MIRPVEIKPLENYKIWIKYSDHTEGIVDLKEFAGKGVFTAWNDYNFFKKVKIGSSGELMWGNLIDLCPDSIYMKLTGKKPEQIFPALKKESVNA